MSPQVLHDAWLVVTAVTILTIGGIALFLLIMFRQSERRRFFWVLAMVLISVSVEQFCAEVKNYYQQAPPELDYGLIRFWLAGRVQEAIISGIGLLYLVFGRNGKHSDGKSQPN